MNSDFTFLTQISEKKKFVFFFFVFPSLVHDLFAIDPIVTSEAIKYEEFQQTNLHGTSQKI